MIINRNLIKLDMTAADKYDAVAQMAGLAKADSRLEDMELFCEKVKERESQVSTDMGFGIAIPHGKTDAVTEPFVALARLVRPIVWNEEEGSTIDLIFMLGSPENSESNIHLVIMSELARHLMDNQFLEDIRTAGQPEQILHYFKQMGE